ncbi:MAG: histidinol dehydrogenase [Erysipelotrichaceae bacterium]|nr:histidinol dehydrogenase [Erysipelotrichaceae bacterium]
MLKAIDKENRQELKEYLLSRSAGISPEILLKTSEIIEDVRTGRDQALKKYTLQFDGVDLKDLQVSQAEIEEAAAKADPAFRQALENAAANIRAFHELQKQDGYRLEKEMGIFLGQRVIPLEAAGIYVPGGRAQYPSSVLMNAIPAKVAGVKRIVMVTPPSKEGTLHPNIAAAALTAGVDEIYKVGGAQAVAALAYGTESIEPVDKIIGPGNIFVAAAKKLVFGQVDIDMIAGPSEILVIADAKANPAHTAADLLSQAEHDPMASAILLSDSQELIDQVNEQLALQTEQLPKKGIVKESLKNYGTSILCDSLEECVEISNAIAPEHLELQTERFEELLPLVKHAGSVFLGYSTCESVGDYFGGTNHVLPTSGTARFSSALSVDAFIKKSSYLYYSPQAIKAYGDQIIKMAEEENLQAHANAVKVRMQ